MAWNSGKVGGGNSGGSSTAPTNQLWVSTEDQNTFTITNGSIEDVKLLAVYVEGYRQDKITLVNNTAFQLPESLPAGIEVFAEWFDSISIGGGVAINDLSTNSTTETWSANKLNSSLSGKSNTGHSHTWSQITSKPSTFTPPVATTLTLGGVKIGSGINVDANGVIGVSQFISNESVKGIKVVTQAEYDALPASKITDNIMYLIRG